MAYMRRSSKLPKPNRLAAEILRLSKEAWQTTSVKRYFAAKKRAVATKPKRTTNKSALAKVEKEFPEMSHPLQKALARKMALLDKLKMHGQG